MLFNSFAFVVFFPLVTAGYFALPHGARWAWLLAASCYFYMHFIPAYLAILGFTIVVDYFAGRWIESAAGQRRKVLLGVSLAANLGLLAFFKYFTFADENLAALAHFLGWSYSLHTLGLLLPLGLSFHTFQAMSYTIEVYRGHQRAERHFGIYALYVMFYPQLVAGPIERPQNLLPQFHARHAFDYERVVSGLRLMAWGLFRKVCVADRLAPVVATVFDHPAQFRGAGLLLGIVFFGFQIYCDFSGYSEIALGSARVMGIELMRNFDRPYAARSVREFWQRWHISLSTWFRDYLYIPLGGNRLGQPRGYLNVFVVFLVSGLWHGAAWTYIVWGALHGAYFILGAAVTDFRRRLLPFLRPPSEAWWYRAGQVAVTFALVNLAWVFFRASSVAGAWSMISHLGIGWKHPFTLTFWSGVMFRLGLTWPQFGLCALGIFLVGMVPFLGARLPAFSRWPWPLRWALYYGLATALMFGRVETSDQFIYFQF